MEPSLEQIEDYNGKESKKKRKTVYFVIAGLFVFGIILASIKIYYQNKPLEIYIPNIEKRDR